MLKLKINGATYEATLESNSSAQALAKWIGTGKRTVHLKDFAGMEKTGPLGVDLPTNDRQTTTKAGDLILYQGNKFVLYYGRNDWSFTCLGHVDNVDASELKRILGRGDVDVTLSME